MNTFEQRYQEGIPPWEIGKPQLAVIALAQKRLLYGEVLDVGCGTGENSLYLASQGLTLLGVDFSRTAIEQAQTKASQKNSRAQFRVGNALRLGLLKKTFDCVLDSALFHVFSDKERLAYAQSLRDVLEPGGTAHILCFSEFEPAGWGPRRVTEAEIRGTFRNLFQIDRMEPANYEVNFRKLPVQARLTSLTRL